MIRPLNNDPPKEEHHELPGFIKEIIGKLAQKTLTQIPGHKYAYITTLFSPGVENEKGETINVTYAVQPDGKPVEILGVTLVFYTEEDAAKWADGKGAVIALPMSYFTGGDEVPKNGG